MVYCKNDYGLMISKMIRSRLMIPEKIISRLLIDHLRSEFFKEFSGDTHNPATDDNEEEIDENKENNQV